MVSGIGFSKFVLLLCMLLVAYTNAALQIREGDCQPKCGNTSVPYPFGLTVKCSLSEEFVIACDSTATPPKLFFAGTQVEVLNISTDGYLRILTPVGRACYSNGSFDASQSTRLQSLNKFPLSSTRNKFVAIGCDTNADMYSETNNTYNLFSRCSSICFNKRRVTSGTCSGTGCCETPIPVGVYNYTVLLTSFYNHTIVDDFNPCSYTFVGEVAQSFKLSLANLADFTNTTVPTVLEWNVGGDQTCKEAMNGTFKYVCPSNGRTQCVDLEKGSGYRCNCTDGYEGNPYLYDGCQNINECLDPNLNNCEKICVDNEGSFACECPKWHRVSGKYGERCIADDSIIIKIIVGIGTGLLVLVVCSSWLYWGYKKRKLLQLKNKYFKQNGGLMLQQQLSKQEGYTETAKIYTAEELAKATNKYDESRIIGQGGFGTVYKGILADGKVVAIKKSKLVDKNQIEQFINEVVVLYQINHRNIVRLLGCCLETEVPLLVYEYVSNGTLFDHIHDHENTPMPWNIRVRIASQIAGVLAYLHRVASPPIIHRDVKSTNILLDENYVAKVSDFGASKLVPIDQTALSTLVQGTLGYLDPEYLLTSQLTEKSDVYSFGVVLVELLTGKKTLCFDRAEIERSLANYFLACLKQDRLHEILEESLKEQNLDQIQEVANLAKKCLSMKGDDRPDMQEVAMELEGLRRVIEKENHPLVVDTETNLEEARLMLEEDDDEDGSSDKFNKFGHGSIGGTSVFDSIQDHVVLSVSDGR